MNKMLLFAILSAGFSLCLTTAFAQTNPEQIRMKAYTRSDGAYARPYFRTAPQLNTSDQYAARSAATGLAGIPGWMDKGSKFNTLFYADYVIGSGPASPIPRFSDRIYVEDEFGVLSSYIVQEDTRTYKVYNTADQHILYLSVTHEGEWRLYDLYGRMIKMLFLAE